MPMAFHKSASRTVARALIGAGLLAAGATLAIGQDRQRSEGWMRAGQLECDVAAGVGLIVASQRSMICRYRPARGGRVETYSGTVRRFGLDVGITAAARMAWNVSAPMRRVPRGALEGEYGGISSEATLGVGLSANALVGGANDGIALQPLALQAQAGLNLAVGVSSMNLVHVR